MKIKFLLLGTSLSFLPTLSLAQCVATQDCATLGYTETSCNGGKGVKCPFGNKWACLPTEAEICKKNGFKYACSGTGYSGGNGDSCGGKYKKCSCTSGYKWSGSACTKESCSSSYKYTCTGTGYSGGYGSACGGKYTQCSCASGYEWKNGSCQKKEVLNGADGDVYKCNGKVVGIKTSGMNFYVAMNDLGNMGWFDANNLCQNYSFCSNVKGTLPTKDQLKTIYNNKSSLNSLLSANEGMELTDDWYWSSTSYYDDGTAYIVNMSDGKTDGDYTTNYVRPVLTSW